LQKMSMCVCVLQDIHIDKACRRVLQHVAARPLLPAVCA
jgi:hypothetical protein